MYTKEHTFGIVSHSLSLSRFFLFIFVRKNKKESIINQLKVNTCCCYLHSRAWTLVKNWTKVMKGDSIFCKDANLQKSTNETNFLHSYKKILP